MKPLRFKAVMKIRDGNPYLLVSGRGRQRSTGLAQTTPVLIRVNGQPKAAWRIT